MTALQHEPGARPGYFSIVWNDLRKNRLAVWGLRAIAALALLAVYAPLVCSSQPFVFRDETGWSAPLFESLFNRLLFENAVDVFFNVALGLTPVFAATVLLAKRRLGAAYPHLRLQIVLGLAGLQIVAFALVVPKHWGPFENPLYHSARIVDYREKAAALAAAGEPYVAVFPPVHYGYRETNPEENLENPGGAHWFGTDTEGRDVFARMVYGTRISLTIGVVAVSLYVAIGIVLGALAGYFGGWVDTWISRLIEVMICFPSFFLILTLAALIENRSIFHVMVIIGVTSWTGVARLVRAEFLKHKALEYADAARALGIPRGRIIFRHILPNAIAPVLVSATFGIAAAILIESSLSFLGIGDLTVPSWGDTLNTGRVEGKLWLILAPGAAIFFVVTVFNLVGEALRDALDPQLRT